MLRGVGGTAAALLLVLGAAAALLRLADTLPGLLRGEPGVRRVADLAEAERLLGARLWMPAYFPDRLRWPPAAVVVHRGPPPAGVLTFVDRAGEAALVMAQALGAGGPVPPALLPPGRTLHAVATPVDGREATLRRFIASDGRIWHDLAWDLQGRRLVLRGRGSVEDLLRMAGSVRPRAGGAPGAGAGVGS